MTNCRFIFFYISSIPNTCGFNKPGTFKIQDVFSDNIFSKVMYVSKEALRYIHTKLKNVDIVVEKSLCPATKGAR